MDDPVPNALQRRPRVSLCMIVKNEEADLPACLASVADLVDEMIVVDTGSTDRTREVAAGFGARVFDFPWIDDFAAARNETLRHATGAWIFWLDADDRLDPANRERLRALFRNLGGENVAYLMKCLCRGASGVATGTVVDHVRLFRNHPKVRWQNRIHEQVLPALNELGHRTCWSDVVIEHVGYIDPAGYRRKLERNLRLLHRENEERPNQPYILFHIGWAYQQLGKLAEAVPYLQRSLAAVETAPWVYRAYSLLAEILRQLGQLAQALNLLLAGRQRCPENIELRFLEAELRGELGDLANAERCLVELLRMPPEKDLITQAVGLGSFKARHRLARLCRVQKRLQEAETHWQAALAECPDFAPACLGLGELYLEQRRWDALGQHIQRLDERPATRREAIILRGLWHSARKEFAAARQVLERLVAEGAPSVECWVALGHVLLEQGKDPAAAARALREVLALDPAHAWARHNLDELVSQPSRTSRRHRHKR